MWTLATISAKNFMSFEDVEFSFTNKCYIIRGENKDNAGQLSNGSGKSSFIDIISVAILGYSLTGRNAKDCVSWNSEDGYYTVGVVLENLEHNLKCEISRKVYGNTRSSELVLLINGQIPKGVPTKKGVKDGVDIKAGDAYILNTILGIKADDLLNYYLISSKYYQPFLQANTDKKLEVISRFANTSVVDKAISKLLLEQETDRDGVAEYNIQINQAKGYIVALQDSMNDSAIDAFEEKKRKEIVDLEDKLKKIETELTNLAGTSDQILYEIGDLKSQTKEPDLKLKEAKEEELADCHSVSIELDGFEKEFKGNIKSVENYLAGLIKCPKCGNEFSLEHPNTDEHYSEKYLKDLQANLAEVIQEIENCKKTAIDLSREIREIEEVIDNNSQLNFTISTLEKNLKSLNGQEDRLLAEYKRFAEELNNVSGRTFADEKASIIEQMRSKEGEIEALEKSCKELEEELDYKTKWIDNFYDFKFYLGNKPIEIICSLVNEYLKLNGSDLNLHIEGFKKLKSGEIRQALHPVIYRNWQDPKDYNQFSEGEKTRLNVSVDLAFQQLINNSTGEQSGLDLMISDELLNSLDSLGMRSAAEAFNSLDKTILLVSHAGADLNYKNTLIIKKENGTSIIQ